MKSNFTSFKIQNWKKIFILCQNVYRPEYTKQMGNRTQSSRSFFPLWHLKFGVCVNEKWLNIGKLLHILMYNSNENQSAKKKEIEKKTETIWTLTIENGENGFSFSLCAYINQNESFFISFLVSWKVSVIILLTMEMTCSYSLKLYVYLSVKTVPDLTV